MVGTRTKLIAALLLSANPVALWAQDGVDEQYRPTGTWHIEYQADMCRLVRAFSDGQHNALLAVEKQLLGPLVQIGVTGDAIRLSRGAKQVSFSFGVDGPPQDRGFQPCS